MRNRKDIEADGVLLDGWIVPDWFKAQSDGGSIPTRLGKWILREKDGRPAAYVHDFDYYLIPLEYKKNSPEWVGARQEADIRLKQNLALIVSRKRWYARFIARQWYRGVRIGGKHTVRTVAELAIPPTAQEAVELYAFVRTQQAVSVISNWIRSFS